MPVIQSAIKKVRVDARRTAINRRIRLNLKKSVKTAKENISAENLRLAQKSLDKAAKKGVIKKNKAARLKSRLAKKVQKNTAHVKTR